MGVGVRWLIDGFCSDTTQVKALSRTYARAIAGTPTAMNFDPETGVFQLTYILNLVPLLSALPNTRHSFERSASTHTHMIRR